MLTTSSSPSIRIAAIGDLLLTSKPGESEPPRGPEALSPEISDLFTGCDIVFAKIESTMFSENKVATEPCVFSSETQIRSLIDSGINLVTLGNNHTFDGKDEDFEILVGLLNQLGLRHFGAGKNLKEALATAIIDINCIGWETTEDDVFEFELRTVTDF